jgi:anti-sigma factor RsiW
MNNCDRIEDYFAGVLEGASRDAFKLHVSGCPRCKERLEQLVRLDRELRRALPRLPQSLVLHLKWPDGSMSTGLALN